MNGSRWRKTTSSPTSAGGLPLLELRGAESDLGAVHELVMAYGIKRLVLAGKMAKGIHDLRSLTFSAWEGPHAHQPGACGVADLLEKTVGMHVHLLPMNDAVI